MTDTGLLGLSRRFSKAACRHASRSLCLIAGAALGCVPKQLPPPDGFLPEDATIRIVNPAAVPESEWTATRLEYPYPDGEETTDALHAFIAEAEQRGALAVSQVEIHTRQRRDGKDTACITHVDPVVRQHKTAKTEKKPGLPPTIETVTVIEKRWEVDQSRSDCHPTDEPLDEQAPHAIVGFMHIPK